MPILYGRRTKIVRESLEPKSVPRISKKSDPTKYSDSVEKQLEQSKIGQQQQQEGINATESTQNFVVVAGTKTPASAAKKGEDKHVMIAEGLTVEEPKANERIVETPHQAATLEITSGKRGKCSRKRVCCIMLAMLLALICMAGGVFASFLLLTKKEKEDKTTWQSAVIIIPSVTLPPDRVDIGSPFDRDNTTPDPPPATLKPIMKCPEPPKFVDDVQPGTVEEFEREITEDESQQLYPAFRPVSYDLHFQIAAMKDNRFRVNTKITGLVSNRKNVSSFMLHLNIRTIFTDWNRSPKDVTVFRMWQKQSRTAVCFKRIVRADLAILRFELTESSPLESGQFYIFEAAGLVGKIIMADKEGNDEVKTALFGYIEDGARSMFPCVDHPKVKARFRLTTETLESSKLSTISAFSSRADKSPSKQIESSRLTTAPDSIFDHSQPTKTVSFDETFPLPPHAFSFVVCQNCETYSWEGTNDVLVVEDGEIVKNSIEFMETNILPGAQRAGHRNMSFRLHLDDSFSSSQDRIKLHAYRMFGKAEKCIDYMQRATQVLYPLDKLHFVQVAKSVLKKEATMGLIDTPTIESEDAPDVIGDLSKGPDQLTRKVCENGLQIIEQWIGNLISVPSKGEVCIYKGLAKYLHLVYNHAQSSLADYRTDKLRKETFWKRPAISSESAANGGECELRVALILDMLIGAFDPGDGLYDWLSGLMAKYKYGNPGYKKWAAEISNVKPLAGNILESYLTGRGYPFLYVVPNGAGVLTVRQVVHETANAFRPMPDADNFTIPILVHSRSGYQSWIMDNSSELTIYVDEGFGIQPFWYVLDRDQMVLTRNFYDPVNYIALFSCFYDKWENIKKTQEIPMFCALGHVKQNARVYADFCFAFLNNEFRLLSSKESRRSEIFNDAFDHIRDFGLAYLYLYGHQDDADHPLVGDNWKCLCCLHGFMDFTTHENQVVRLYDNITFHSFELCTYNYWRNNCAKPRGIQLKYGDLSGSEQTILS